MPLNTYQDGVLFVIIITIFKGLLCVQYTTIVKAYFVNHNKLHDFEK